MSWLSLCNWLMEVSRRPHSFEASVPVRLPYRLSAALHRHCGCHDGLVRVGNERHADAGRLEDVDGVMRMPGQTWLNAAASFLGMWVVMMAAMMLPSLVQILWRYRKAVCRTGETRLGALTALVGVGYFVVWTAFGMAVFPLGAALASIEMEQPLLAASVPMAVGVVVLTAGAVQFTGWKAHRLACCRAAGRVRMLPADAGAAWRHRLRLGLDCVPCCANLMTILVVIGVMDLRIMAVVTAAITAERLAPDCEPIARATGVMAVGAGLWLIARAAALG
jgi:predicted metal-binding membrane protein